MLLFCESVLSEMCGMDRKPSDGDAPFDGRQSATCQAEGTGRLYICPISKVHCSSRPSGQANWA